MLEKLGYLDNDDLHCRPLGNSGDLYAIRSVASGEQQDMFFVLVFITFTFQLYS